ncbi:MAG: hypothetical protein DCC49_11545 [Acidobacteria bacterium]|nr:MAG: hypothetical protein DCC49_11545 [Acidobacteriota bacterium]
MSDSARKARHSLVLDPISLFSKGSRHLGLPTVAITGIAAYLAWRQGGNGVLLGAVFAATVLTLIAGWLALRLRPGEFPITSQSFAVAGLIATQASIAVWAFAYRGLDGGFWINLMTVSFVAGILLRARYALVVGMTGSITFLAIALASHQLDAAHLPTLAVGLSYVFLLAVLAASYRRAILQSVAEEQVHHVETLENSNLEMTAVIQSLVEGLLTTDKYGRVQRWNMALENLAGRSEMEASGMPVSNALPLLRGGKTLDEAEHPCVRALTGPVFDGSNLGSAARELLLLKSDGSTIPVTISAAPLMTESGPAGVSAVVLDVTREREIGRLRDSIVSAVSHEIRTPLTMILGFSEMLVTGGLSEQEKAECFRQLLESAQSLNSLIEDLLSASAIEAGQLDLNRRSVPVAGLVESVRQGMSEADRARITSKVPPDLVVNGDPDRLSQVMNNLVANALKFSSPDSPVVIEGAASGSEVTVAVIDFGIGVSAEQIDLLFNKFARADDEKADSISGAGLGLYVVDQIISLHGGHTEASSEVGVGTKIKFTLPAQ